MEVNDLSNSGTGRLGGYGLSPSAQSRLAFADRIDNHMRWTEAQLGPEGPGEKAPDEVKAGVRELQRASADQGRALLQKADEQAQALHDQADRLSVGRTPEQAAALHDQADRMAASVYDHAQQAADGLMRQTGEQALGLLTGGKKHGGLMGLAKGMLGMARDVAGSVVEHVKDFVFDKAQDLVNKASELEGKAQDFAHDRLQDLEHFAESQIAEHTPLGAEKFTGEKMGVLGNLITNRLGIGDSVSIKVSGSAKLGDLPLNFSPNEQLQLRRVQATRPDGTPITEPKDANGNPPTMLQLTLIAKASLGNVNPEGEGGKGPTPEAQVGGQGAMMIRAEFDPNNQKDVDDLKQVLGGVAGANILGAVPGAVASFKAAEGLKGHVTELAGEAGGFAVAQLALPFGINPATLDGAVNGEATRKATKLLGNLDGKGLNLNGGASVHVGVDFNVRSGQVTVLASGDVQGQFQALGFGGKGAGRSRVAAMTLNPDGVVANFQIQDTKSLSEVKGAGGQDPQGNLTGPVVANHKGTDLVTTTSVLGAADLEALNRDIGINPLGAAGTLIKAPLEVATVTSTHQSDITVGGGNSLLAGTVDLGFEHTETVVDHRPAGSFGIG